MSTTAARRRVRRHDRGTPRPPGETRTAALAAGAVVAGTALAVWFLRPAGLAARQPRATWLVVIALLLLGGLLVWARRGRGRLARHRRTLLPVGVLAVVAGATVAWVAWPGGIVRDDGPGAAPFDELDLGDLDFGDLDLGDLDLGELDLGDLDLGGPDAGAGAGEETGDGEEDAPDGG